MNEFEQAAREHIEPKYFISYPTIEKEIKEYEILKSVFLAGCQYISGKDWVKASDQLPPSLDFADVYYRLDGKKSNGIIMEVGDGYFVFEWKEAAIYKTTTDLSRVEWLRVE